MRTLASIKQIADIQPIEGKDRIALAIVDGWSVIIQKADYNVGDLCVFCEIDSVLPEKPEFEFLRKNNFRIKTMRMSGCLSQGICFPLRILPEGEYQLGDDVTEIMGVTQYEPTMDVERPSDSGGSKKKYPKCLMRMTWFRKLVLPKKGNQEFPSFIHKTDEPRVQNMPYILTNKNGFIASEKIDGSSGTFCLVRHKSKIPFFKDKFDYIVCSRNLRIPNKDNSAYWRVSDRYNIQQTLKSMIGDHDWIAIQGECIAPNIQKNKYHITEPDLYVFNLIYPTGRLGSLEAKEICEQNGLKFVPIVDTNYILPDTVQEILDYAHGTSQLYDTLREGIVFRSKDGKQSFKAVDPLFLIKHDE